MNAQWMEGRVARYATRRYDWDAPNTAVPRCATWAPAALALRPGGMAQARGAAMLSASASADQMAFVQQAMAQINPADYAQAARMLADGDLLSDLSLVRAQSACPVWVASGSADTITPPAGCQQVAAHIHAPYTSLGAVGHACAIEAADEVTRLIGLAAPAAASSVPAAASGLPAATSAMPMAKGAA